MLQRILFIPLLLIVQVYNVKSEEAFYPEASFFAQDTDFFLHTIERGETVYSIAGMYHVSVDAIYQLNPGSKEGIKIGNSLKIPQESGSYFYHTIQEKETLYSVSRQYQMKGEDIMAVNPGLSIETFTMGKIIRIPTNKVTSPSKETNETADRINTEALLNQEDINQGNIEKIKIALLLPFGLKEGTTPANAAKNRMVEYYEGFLLALNELKKKNISVQLQVYDTGTKTDTLKAILKTKELQDIHLLIGGLSDEQIQLLSGFASKLGIPYVIPFTSTSNEPLNNYNVYQVNTTPSLLYSKTSLAFFDKFKNSNILFYDSGTNANKADLTAAMKADFAAKKIPYQIVYTESDILSVFSNVTDLYRNCVIVPSDDSKLTLTKLVEILKVVKESHPEASVSMFGHPAWQTYAAEFSSDFFRLNTTIYTVFYANPTSLEVKSFISKYHRWYTRDLINTFPKYGMLGYDTGMFFIQLLNRYGNAIDSNINRLQYNGIQTDFHFDRVNNWGGFINVNIYFVEFGKDFKVNIKRIE